MFLELLENLRAVGIKVSTTEWLSFMTALCRGHHGSSLTGFYNLARALLVKREAQFDLFDQAFAFTYQGLEKRFAVDDALLRWLENPKLPPQLSEEELAALKSLDLDTLRRMFEERLHEQDARHDGGSKWIGTGGTSPFGHGGVHPTGVRIGGPGGGRSAVQVAEERQFRNLRTDRVLDTRQISVALRRLRKLARTEGPEELDVEATIDKTARDGGEIDLVFAPPKKNRVKLLLLMDVGGSMDPHALRCERLFSAAHAASHFARFESYYFHNCVYERLYSNMEQFESVSTDDLLKRVDESWSLVIVGDAWMSPYELTHIGGAISYFHRNPVPGIEWLKRLRRRMPRSVWLNPEGEQVWHAHSIALVRSVFPMFPLTLDGITDAVDLLRGAGDRRGRAA